MVRVLLSIVLVTVVGLYIVFVYLTNPKSDEEILKLYQKSEVTPKITHETYKGFGYRKITLHHSDSLPTLVFVHGTIGSISDFTKYLSDSILQQKANMISYDRIGYNYKDEYQVQESIAFERSHLQDVIKNIPSEKVVVVGYSYGGPIALSLKEKIKKIVLLAPAVYSEVEPMPFLVNLYKWKLTRFLIPNIWQQASKEKLSHQQDLRNFQQDWKSTENSVLSIHGTKDWIVPIENSFFLEEQFPKDRFSMLQIEGAGHELIWTNFLKIKKELEKQL